MRHRYERLSRFPDGLLVVGDAVCSFNPIYGQGMSVAALEALALRRHLERGTTEATTSSSVTSPAWSTRHGTWPSGGDLVFPDVQGRKTVKVRLLSAYLGQAPCRRGRERPSCNRLYPRLRAGRTAPVATASERRAAHI